MSAERNKRQCVHVRERKQMPIYPTDNKWPSIGGEENGILEIQRQRCDKVKERYSGAQFN